MKQADLSLLPEYLTTRRWFAGKAWPVKHVSLVDSATLQASGRPDFVLGVIEVAYTLGKPER